MPIVDTCKHPRCFNPKPCAIHPQATSRVYNTVDEKKFYGGTQWKRIREAHRRKEPLCRACLAKGHTRIGALVDHIIAIRDGGSATDDANLQTLCDPCHQSKRQSERRGVGSKK